MDVVAHVDIGTVPGQDGTLPGAPDAALDDVHVEAEMVDVQLGVGRVLPGDQHDPPLVSSYGSKGLGHPRERRCGADRVLGIDLAEPVGRRLDLPGRQMRPEQDVQGRAELRGHVRGRELHPELGAQRVQRCGETHDGVDQRHVEVEPDHQLISHGASLRRRPSQRSWTETRPGPQMRWLSP